MSFTSWALLPAALVPGILSWFWGRRLHRHIGDPLFPERFWLHRRRTAMVSGAAGALGGYLLARRHVDLSVFLSYLAILLLGVAFANYDTRKRIFGDTWSFAAYALFRSRFALVSAGFWLTIGAAPYVIVNSGRAAPVVAALFMMVLLAWHLSSSRATAWLLGAEPLEDEGVQASLSRLLAKTSLPRPLLFRAGPPGAVLANAFALPKLGGSGVLFFRTLLERLSAIEIEAILAHELAHLEQFSETVLRRQRWMIVTLIVIGAGVLPLVLQRYTSPWIASVWLAAIVATMISIGRGAKQRETAGDLRAAELVGDPEALITALTRLYAIGHLPRRWDAATEARATHPALARRIRALRATAEGGEPVAPIVIRARAPGEVLIFDSDRVRYLRDVAGDADDVAALVHSAARAESFLYEKVSGVHIAPTTLGADVVIESAGTAVARVAVAPEQIAAVQSALDRFDVKFAGAVATGSHGLAVRLVAVVIGVVGYFVGPAVVLLQAFVAVVGSSPRAAAALAAATTTLLLYLISRRPQDLSGNGIVALLALLAWLLAVRWRRRVEGDGPRARLEIAALAMWSIIALIPFFIVSPSMLRVAQVAAGPPAAVAAALSVGAWLWFSAGRRARRSEIAVLALLLLAIGMASIGTTSFVDAFSRDPFLATRRGVGGPRFTATTIELTPVSSPIAVPPGELRVSPNARAFAIVEPCEDEDESSCPRRGVTVGDTGSLQRHFEAADVQFLDDHRIVVLAATDAGAMLRTEDIAGHADGWTVPIEDAPLHTLMVDPASGRWFVMAEEDDARVFLSGRVGEAEVARTAVADDVALADGDPRYVDWKGAGGDQLIGLASRFTFYSDVFFSELRRAVLPRALTFAEDTAVLVPGTPAPRVIAESALDLRCIDSASVASGVVCFANEGWRTHVWRIDPATEALTVLGWFDGTAFVHAPPARDRWLLSSGRCTWRVLDVASKSIATLGFPAGTCPTSGAVSAEHVVLLVAPAGNNAQLSRYALR